MTLRKEKLEGFRKDLSERRDVMASDLIQATQGFINDDTTFTDSIDQAAADTDRSLAMQMKNRERGILTQIDAALRRIEEGRFGDCAQCGEEISEARLKAFPLTTLCIDCKAELESEEQRYSGRA